MEAAKKLPLSAVFFAMLAAVVGAVIGTDRNVMPADWNEHQSQHPGVRVGTVDLAFRTSQRLFVLKFPNNEDRIFRLRLPANPMKEKYREWSQWQKPDFVAKAGEQPSRASGGSDYQVRYKVEYQDR